MSSSRYVSPHERLAQLEQKLDALLAYVAHIEHERDQAIAEATNSQTTVTLLKAQQSSTRSQLAEILEQLKEIEANKDE